MSRCWGLGKTTFQKLFMYASEHTKDAKTSHPDQTKRRSDEFRLSDSLCDFRSVERKERDNLGD